jgi:hypothetical protein
MKILHGSRAWRRSISRLWVPTVTAAEAITCVLFAPPNPPQQRNHHEPYRRLCFPRHHRRHGGPSFRREPRSRAQPFASTRTRAEVQAELSQFSQVRNPWSTSYDQLADFRSGFTREEVRAEYIASRDQVAVVTGEDSGSFALGHDQELGTQLAGVPVRAE